jgi:spore coat protein U-like protein
MGVFYFRVFSPIHGNPGKSNRLSTNRTTHITRRKNNMKKLLAITAAAALMAMAGTAMAATTTTNLTVEANVLAACTATKNTDIDFGDLNPLTDPATSNTSTKAGATRGQITVNCTAGTSYSLSGPASATMAQGMDTITYSPVIPTTSFTGSVAGASHFIDAEVTKTAYASAPSGAYTGTLTVTVTY